MSKLRSDELVNMEGDGSPNFPQGATSIEPTANNQVATKSYVDSTISAGLGNVVSSTAPTNPVFGSFWTDTSVAPRVLKTWDGTAWVEFDGTTAGISGLIRPPVEVLTPLNGSGITVFNQYEPLSSTITAVGEAGTITKNTDEIQSVADEIAWQESQVWSNDLQSSSGWLYQPTSAFDGIGNEGAPYTYAQVSVTGSSITFTPSTPISYSESISIFMASAGGTASVNGAATVAVANSSDSVIASGSGTLTSLVLNASNSTTLMYIKVDGKFLIDAGVRTPATTGNKVLSFPTNTNFSGLSVGDVVQREYATWNPLAITPSYQASSLTNGNLDAYVTGDSRNAYATIAFPASGKYFFEVTLDGSFSGAPIIGVSAFTGVSNAYPSSVTSPSVVYYWDGTKTVNGSTTSYGATFGAGDVIGVAVNIDSSTVTFYKNGSSQGSISLNVAGAMPHVGTAGATGTYSLNAGARPFAYPAPSGYLGLSNPAATITAIDASAPSQQTVYATLNPLAKSSGVTLSNGNLDASVGGDPSKVLSTIGMTSGKYYAEFTVSSGSINPGLATSATNLGSGFLGNDGGSWCYGSNGKKYHNDPGASGATYGATYTTGDVIGVAFDADNGSLTFYKNGATQGAAYTGLTSGPYFIAAGGSYSSYSTNFGATAFAHTPPSGYVGLSELVTTYPSVTVDGGTWTTSDHLISQISYEKSLTFTDTTELANMVTPLEMVDANRDVVTPVSDTIANVNNNVLTLQGNTNLAYFQPGDEVQTGVEIVSVDTAAPSITVDGGDWLGADGTNSAKRISRSLRFNIGDTPELIRTPSSAGNTSKFTISFWAKRSKMGSTQMIVQTGNSYSNLFRAYWDGNDNFRFHQYNGSYVMSYITSARYRDPSAWYHYVISIDTTLATAANRARLYVNGVEVTEWTTETNPAQNLTTGWNAAIVQRIGREYTATYGNYYNYGGFLAEFYNIDGLALAPTEFGEFDDNNVWQAKEFAGTYGTNGFHLDFSDNSSNAALGYDAAGSNDWTVNNLTASHGNGRYVGDVTGTPYSSAYPAISAFDGNVTSTYSQSVNSGNMTFTPSSPISVSSSLKVIAYTTGSTSTFTVNGTDYRSLFTGTGTQTITIPETSITSIVWGRSSTGGSSVQLQAIEVDGSYLIDYTSSGNENIDSLVDVPANYGDDTGAGGEVRGNYATLNPLNTTTQTLSNGNLGSTGVTGRSTGTIYVSSGKWYWEFTAGTSYTMAGIESSTNTFTSYPGGSDQQYALYGNAGSGQIYHNGSASSFDGFVSGDVIGVALDMDGGNLYFYKNGSAMNSGTAAATGLTGLWTANCRSGSGGYDGETVFNFGQRPFAYAAPSGYKALCDTNLPSATIKDGSKHFDVVTYTGNGSTQTISGLNFSPDLVWTKSRSTNYSHQLIDIIRGGTEVLFSDRTDAEGTYQSITAFNSDGYTLSTELGVNGSGTPFVAWAWNAGDTTETIAAGDLNSSVYDQSQTWSNWSAETGSLYIDGLRVSAFNNDFTNIGPGSYPDVIQWNGSISWSDKIEIMVANQASPSQSGNKGAWFFEFTHAGGTLTIDSSNWTGHNSTDAEISAGTIPFFDFTSQLVSPLTRIRVHGGAGSHQAIGIGAIKTDGKLLVDPGVSVPTIPSINSVVRANPTAGFSIVGFTGGGSGSTFGHGLNAAPHMIIVKDRDTVSDWCVYHKDLGGGNFIKLNSTDASAANTTMWGNTDPTSSVFGWGFGSGNDYIAYCFAPVEGYSAMGSYTGNGSANGPFVNLNFKPAFVLIKGNQSISWHLFDNKREGYNVANDALLTNHPDGEFSNVYLDLLSNGFKVRQSTNGLNSPGVTYIYMAFAENPVAQDAQTVTTGDTQVALDPLAAIATEIVETDGTTMYLNSATGPWRTGLSIEGSQINAAPPGPSEVTFTTMNNGTTPVSMIDATLSTRTWTLESSTTSTGPWTSIDTYTDFDATDSQDGATPWTTTRPTLQPNTYYRVKVAYNSTNADSVESVYSTFKTGDA